MSAKTSLARQNADQSILAEAKIRFAQGHFDQAVAMARWLIDREISNRVSASLLLAQEALTRGDHAIDELLAPVCDSRQYIGEFLGTLWLAARASRKVDRIRAVAAQIASAVPNSQLAKEAASYAAFLLPSDDEILVPSVGGSTIPFLAECGLPVVMGSAVGRELRFLLDTGADDLVLSVNAARSLGLPMTRSGRGLFAGGRQASVWRSFLDELRLGDLFVERVPVSVLRAIPQLGADCPPIDGIIGTQIFRLFHVTWDYANNRLELAPSGHADTAPNPIPLRLLRSHILVANARLDTDIEGLFFVDSGGTVDVAVDRRGWRSISRGERPLTAMGHGGAGRLEYRLLPGQSLSIGSSSITEVCVVGGVFPERLKKETGVDLRGIISHGVLSRFRRVTIDYRRLRLFLE